MKSQLMYRHSTLLVVIIVIILTSCSGNPPSTATHASFATPTSMLTPTAHVPALQGTAISPARDELSVANADQIVQLARWGKGVASYIKYSPDGKYLVVSSTVGTYIYTGDTYLLLASYEPDPGGTEGFAFFPDGKSLAVSTDDGLDILSIPDGALLRRIDEKARMIAISPDGKMIAIAACIDEKCRESQVKVFWWASLTLLHTFDPEIWIRELVFSADGNSLGIVSNAHVLIWNLIDQTEFFTSGPTPIKDTPYDLAFSSNGQYFAISTYSDVLLYDMGSRYLLNTLKLKHYRPFYCVEFSPDGNILAAGSEYINEWQVSDGKLVKTFTAEPSEYPGVYTSLSWSIDGKSIATASRFDPQQNYHSAIIWNVEEGTPEKNLDGYMSEHFSIDWFPSGDLILLGSGNYNSWAMHVLSAINGRVVENNYWGPKNPVGFVQLIPLFHDNSIIERIDQSGLLEIRQISEKSLGNQYWVLGESPGAFTFSNGGKLLATVNHTEDYSHDIVVIRRTNDLSIVQSMDIDKDNSVEVLNFDPSGQELLILLSKGKLVSLSINDGSSEIIDKYPQGIASHISGFATSPDKKSFVIITWDGTIRIYHQDKPPILISEGWSSFANNIKYEAAMFPVIDWSSNGELLAVSANNNSIVIFDANKQTILCSLSGTSKDITDLEFSPDGSLLASTSYDGTIRLWGIP